MSMSVDFVPFTLLPVELRQAAHVQRYIQATVIRGVANEEKKRSAAQELSRERPPRLSRPASAPQFRTQTDVRVHAAQYKHAQLCLEKEERRRLEAAQKAVRERESTANAGTIRQARLDRLSEIRQECVLKSQNAEMVRRQQNEAQAAAVADIARSRSELHAARWKALKAAKLDRLQEKRELHEERADMAWKFRQDKALEADQRRFELDEAWQLRREQLDWDEARKMDKLDKVKAKHKKVFTEKQALQTLVHECDLTGDYGPAIKALSAYQKRMGLNAA